MNLAPSTQLVEYELGGVDWSLEWTTGLANWNTGLDYWTKSVRMRTTSPFSRECLVGLCTNPQ